MPKITTGSVQPGQNGVPKLYGTDKVENTIPFQERLMRLFKPHEFVIIKNIDDEPLYWQYLPQEAENITNTDDGMQQIVTREAPEMWMIEPGETEALVGASAYRALDILYKNVTAKKTLRRFKDPTKQVYDETGNHQPRNFNFADGGAQEDFINQAYLGKAQMSFNQVGTIPDAITPTAFAETQSLDEAPVPNIPVGAPVAPVTYAEPETSVNNRAKNSKSLR